MLLTNEEYEEAKNTLHDTTLARKLTANKRKQLRKRLKDYEYSVKYLPFKPTNYTIKHINKTTEIPDLEKYILDSKNATRFFIDTKSTIKPYHPNEPALIQIMILRKDQSSIVLLVEVRHLPHQESQEFESIQELFRVIFQPKSLIHIWGNRDELKSFFKYQLLTNQQISSLNVRNEQGEFKTYWLQTHPHDDNNSSCICEYCINKEPNDPWSLTDAIAYVEQRWLDKSWTISPFNIGLDEKLYEQSPQQKAYRKKLSLYAAYDCLAIHAIWNKIDPQQQQNQSIWSPVPSPSPPISPAYSWISDDEAPPHQSSAELTSRQSSSSSIRSVVLIPSAQPSSSEQTNKQPSSSHNTPLIVVKKQKLALSATEKKLKNAQATLRQRKRKFMNEIIIHAIDDRFSVHKIKQVLNFASIEF
ncbi:unnamed protein product [Didymodactylos carnosus]|uniref:Uncharacterized protein n=1 Tax=Didymodactylos carnosus TaxID=1234261 RepID=A0A8S2K7A4_9BILA|nr:unnamed protein product [Didymodactylos carnosus]CAF3840564.1 unnamed protein product [Didymodactylos carnosus]